MSGTSADSIDVAVCRMTGQGGEAGVELLHYREHRARSRGEAPGASATAGLDVRGVAELHVMVGEAFAAACLATLEDAGLSPHDIDLIGSHGQTVYHHSGVAGAIRATLQVGDGDVIAVRTGCHVVSDFRARDIAAGGEGAPLSPIADVVLFGGARARSPAPPGDPEPGRDRQSHRARRRSGAGLRVRHGPGECAARPAGTAALRRRLGLRSRRPIRPVRTGQRDRCSPNCWSTTLPRRRPPKSTGFEMYGDAFVARAAERHGGFDADLMATLTEFVARTIALGLGQCDQLGPPVEEIIAAGGGVKNPVLMERIAAALAPVPIRRSDELGVPSDAREAMAFAVLADMTLRGQAACLPPVTGAAGAQAAGQAVVPLRSSGSTRPRE